MTGSELVKYIAHNSKLHSSEAKQVFDLIIQNIKNIRGKAGERIEIEGFGVFYNRFKSNYYSQVDKPLEYKLDFKFDKDLLDNIEMDLDIDSEYVDKYIEFDDWIM